jgi:hypothetical protein
MKKRNNFILLWILVPVLVLLILILSKSTKELYNNETIFISIASYRDKECPNTVNSIFENATYPHNIFLGICQQNKSDDIDCFDPRWKNNIRIIRLKDTDAKGPTYARWHCSKLYSGEDYFMQIDSHSKFVKDWDTKLLKMIKNIPDSKAVLSNYPNDWDTVNENDNTIPVFCDLTFEEKIIKPKATLITPNDDFNTIPIISGCFFFTKGTFLNDVPYDPELPHLFHGEEILFSIRLWTHGYNFYAPNERIIYHYYYRNDEPKYWESEEFKKWQPLSFQKVEYILHLRDNYHNLINLSPSSILGNERSLNDYYNFIGFDKDTKTFSKKFC